MFNPSSTFKPFLSTIYIYVHSKYLARKASPYIPSFGDGTKIFWAAILLALFWITPAAAQSPIQLPEGFVYETVIEKLDGPTGFAFSPDGRIFITQKAGAVKVFHNGSLLRENFIDLSSQVNQYADRGLMSVAVHPNFPATPYVYFAFTYEPPQATTRSRTGGRVSRVVRVTADPANLNRHQPGSEVVLLGKNSTFDQIGNPTQAEEPPFSCVNSDNSFVEDCLPAEGIAHVANHLIFGRDGSLFVSNGDGTVNPTANIRAQQIDSLAGKILRIDPINGQGYADNPFFDGNPSSNRSKVYALGLRNPFRIAQNAQTGALMVAEVGNETWEELSLATAGANLGWPCFEGPDQASIDPICVPLFNRSNPVTSAAYQYRHTNGFGAVIGGDFYTGTQFPPQYRNTYFFSDYPASVIQYLTFDPSGSATVNDFATNASKITQTKMGADGSLYLLSIGDGELGRISHQNGRANPSTAPAQTLVPTPVPSSSAAPTPQPNTRALTVVIQRVPSTNASTNSPSITPSTTPSVARSSAPSTASTTASTSALTSRNVPPQAIILQPSQNITADIGTVINIKGEGRDEIGILPAQNLTWDAILHHKDHIHYDFFSGSGTDTSFTFADHGDDTYIELCLTATDAGGLTDRSCVNIRPNEVTYTFQSEPEGVAMLYNGTRYTTPFQITTYVGARRFIAAPQNLSGQLAFSAWSNQGPRQQRITIQENAQTIRALYTLSATTSPAASPSSPPNVGAEQALQPTQALQQRESEQPTTLNQLTPPQNLANRGTILREWWRDISGSRVEDLVNAPAFPDRPSGSELLNRLEGPSPFADNYGTRIRGYLHPPVTGTYSFWIASDDSSQLWLSSDANPANKVLIARVTHWTPRRKWDQHGEQASLPITLQAGAKYYIEVLHKEAAQKDNISVAWQISGRDIEVIDGQYLSPPE